jgi:hypothetical protein
MIARCGLIISMLLLTPAVCLTGCVERTISISSEPSGALVYLNDREVGRTPLKVEFLYYGTYDVRLVKDGYEPLLTKGDANAPWWDVPGVDLAAELVPARLQSEIEWHFDLTPADDDPSRLIERAREMQAATAAELGRGEPVAAE